MHNQKKLFVRWFLLFVLSVLLLGLSWQYLNYISIAKTTIPIMDFWHWITVFGEKVYNDTITFADYFSSDVGEHIQPIPMFINFSVLKWADFDVQPLVEIGAILRVLMAVILVGSFLFCYRKRGNELLIYRCLTAVALFYSVINYNQWELATEPFNLSNVFRVSIYYFSFSMVCVWLGGLDCRSMLMNMLYGFLLGLGCAAITMLVGGAYFVGHLISIGLAFLWVLAHKRKTWKQDLLPMLAWGILSFIAALAYYLLLKQRGTFIKIGSVDNHAWLLFIEGICLFWGALFIPTQIINQYGNAVVTMIGAVTLVFGVYVLIRYLYKHQDGYGMFPAVCFLYAVIQAAVITTGRIDHFGISVMSGSRYVVESSIGWFGLLWMCYDITANAKTKMHELVIPIVGVILSLALLINSANVQMFNAPYIQTHFQSLSENMKRIEYLTDDELSGFQAFIPNDIRYCVDFFKKNNLSIFKASDTE